jgi:hypothetical protein
VRADIEFRYVDQTVRDAVPTSDPAAVAACASVQAARESVGVVAGLHNIPLRLQVASDRNSYVMRGYQYVSPTKKPLVTTISAAEAVALAGTRPPTGMSEADLLGAMVDVWHDLSGNEGDPAAINAYDSVNVTWGGGFAAAGLLQLIISVLCRRSPDAAGLLAAAGIGVERHGTRLAFVAVDTDKRWKLWDDDAERYIRADKRLLSLLIRLGDGSVPPALLDGDTAGRNAALVQAAMDAQFEVLVQAAGRVPGFALLPPWTRSLRAAVAHNIHFGCLPGGWAPYAATAGVPVRVVRALVYDYGCSAASLLSSSADRFTGVFSHGALGAAAASLPAVTPQDDGKARYVLIAGTRRRVDR